MIKYKVTFEITNRVGDSLFAGSSVNKDLLNEKLQEYRKDYKKYVEQMIFEGIEHQYDEYENFDKIKVTDFKIEEV